MSIEAMKQALEALEFEFYDDNIQRKMKDAITALRQAIEEAKKQEPVGTAGELFTFTALQKLDFKPSTKLYTHPPKRELLELIDENQRLRAELKFNTTKREWVGLTDAEIDSTFETQVWNATRSYARAIETKLKEKNT